MNPGQRLEQYLEDLRRRLQAVVVARAGAVVSLTALLITVAAVLVLREPGFPSGSVMIARIVLAVALLVAAGAMLWQPLSALHARNRARMYERYLPAQKGRIETYLELARRRDAGGEAPLIDLLAEDALVQADREPVSTAVPPWRLWVPVGGAAVALISLALLLALGSAEWGFGSRNLWFGAAIPREQIALRDIAVTPGDTTVRRNQDVPIHASLSGFKAQQADVFVKFGNSQSWERAPMQVGEDGAFGFTLYALREPLTYYVASNGTKSAEHRIGVVDAPRIEKMRLTYTYPSWTGLKPETDDMNRDINAVAGTRVSVEVQTTAPLDSPTLVLDGSSTSLQGNGTVTSGVIDVKKAGHYRISARVGNDLVPLTDEQEISIIEDQAPTIELAKPARDWQASSIEEVPVEVHARDDFRVQDVQLHYSVNGGDWKVVPMKASGKDVTGDTILRLEDMHGLAADVSETKRAIASSESEPLTPGDLVTYYAVAKDRKQSVQTDLFLIHVQPFERRYTQGQAGGMQGGGGGDDQQNAISQRQREILLATWNLKRKSERPDNREAERLEENARMLSEAQGTLADQAHTLIDRAAARGVDSADPKNRELLDNLEQAAKAMQPAAKDLNDVKLADAIPSEQKALQHLLRAEALYTDIEVQFRNSQAGGGGGQQAGRDLAEMFELEMDLDKNQYETQSRAKGDQSSQQMDEALRKLRELAQRQERLAREAARQQQQPREADRWQQEQLKRETENLRKQLADLAKQNANSQSAQNQPGQQGQQGQQSQSGQSNQGQPGQGGGQGQSSSEATAREALNQVEQALQNMQNASSSQGSQSASNNEKSQSGGQQSPAQAARSAQLASRDLKQALEKLEQGRSSRMAGSFDDLAKRSQQMLEEQRKQESELLNAYSQANAGPGRQRGLSWERAESLADEKRSLQNQLDELQRDMQGSAQQHSEDAPDASKRVRTAASDLAESGLSTGLARSAMELERGRGVQAATRERLITEALENLQNDLNQAARLAATEARQRGSQKEPASPEELLAELSELRRAWQQAQANALANGRGGIDPRGALDPNRIGDPREPNARQQSLNGQQRQSAPNGPRGADGTQAGGDQPGDGESQSGESSSSQSASNNSQSGGQSGGDSRSAANGGSDRGGGANTFGGYGGGDDRGWLGAWNPPLSAGNFRSGALRPGTELRMQTDDIARRLRDMLNRMPQNALAPADLSALRKLVNGLRASGKDPMESEYRSMSTLVDQIELAALSASEKARDPATTHTADATPDSPEYRETVAEYYRRLGGGAK